MVTGLLAVLIEPKWQSWVMGVSAFAYGTTLFLAVFADWTITGLPSFFLLVFMVILVTEGMKERARRD